MYMSNSAKSIAKSAQISAVITRADGTIENVGVVAFWHRNPLKRWAWSISQAFKQINFGVRK